MNTAVTNIRLQNVRGRYLPVRKPSEPTPEDQARIAPVCNMLFALSMVLESISMGVSPEVYAYACVLRSRVNDLVPGVAESFGDWADTVETALLDEHINRNELTAWIIAKIYALNAEMTAFYRQYDMDFSFMDEDIILKLKNLQRTFRKSTAATLNLIVTELMNA